MQTDIVTRIKIAIGALCLVLLGGTVGFSVIEGWPIFDSLYVTIITLTTIGYGDMTPGGTPGRIFTILLSLCGLGVMAYSFSMLTAFIIGGEMTDVLRRRKMEARIRELDRHYVICGAGYTGHTIMEELSNTDRPFVVIEKDESKAKRLKAEGRLVVHDDALSEDVLEQAGVRKARGLFCTLDSDRDNVFLALTARGLNPTARIVSEVHDDSVRDMLARSGVNAAVGINYIGGLRMASEMIRPAAVGFLDSMIRDRKSTYRFEEVVIPESSAMVGKPVGSIKSSPGEVPMILAIKPPNSASFSINPASDVELKAKDVLVVLGSKEELGKFKQSVLA